MNKRIKGRSLGREKDQKKALMRTLLVSLIESKKITTTLAKAKELRPFAERTLTLAKRGLDKTQRFSKIRLLKKDLPQKSVNEIFEIAKIAKREGGYTRIIKLMPRKSDASPMAMIEWVDKPAKKIEATKKASKTVKEKSATKAKKSTDSQNNKKK